MNYSQPELSTLPSADKLRLGVIEGRPDLFATATTTRGRKSRSGNILAASRDPGSLAALRPVIDTLSQDYHLPVTILTDGRAKESLQEPNRHMRTPADSIYKARFRIPEVILACQSTNLGLDLYAAATFPYANLILVEDLHGSLTRFLNILHDNNRHPQKICVIDHISRDHYLRLFPDYKDLFIITGSPATDRFARMNKDQTRKSTREKLQLQGDQKLVTFISAMDNLDKMCEIAGQLGHVPADLTLALRLHPRDNRPFSEFEAILLAANPSLKLSNTNNKFTTDEIMLASDCVVTGWSTVGLFSVCCGIPVIYIHTNHGDYPTDLIYPPPAVSLGAAVGIDNLAALPDTLTQLLDPLSPKSRHLQENMQHHYQPDGNNAQRVTSQVLSLLHTQH